MYIFGNMKQYTQIEILDLISNSEPGLTNRKGTEQNALEIRLQKISFLLLQGDNTGHNIMVP